VSQPRNFNSATHVLHAKANHPFNPATVGRNYMQFYERYGFKVEDEFRAVVTSFKGSVFYQPLS